MANIIALGGAHRVGKSTLARALVERLNKDSRAWAAARYEPADLSGWFKTAGRKPTDAMTAEERLEVQRSLVAYFAEKIGGMLAATDSSIVVTDRSPLDFIPFATLNVGRMLTSELSERLWEFKRWCLHLNSYVHSTVILQPGIPLKPEPFKAELCPVYIDNINDIIVSTACRLDLDYSDTMGHLPGIHAILPRSLVNLEERVEWMINMIQSGQQPLH